MTTLILATALSEALIQIAISERHRMAGDIIVVDTDDGIHAVLKQHRISSIPLRATSDWDWGERDSRFRELFMPGAQLDVMFPGTDLPIWKVLAMDRLSFWYQADTSRKLYDYVMALRWDSAYVSADLNHPLPWAIARYSGRKTTFVKVSSHKTREWLDLSNSSDLFLEAIGK